MAQQYKYYFSVFNVDGVPTQLDFFAAGLHCLYTGHFSEEEYAQYINDVDDFINVVFPSKVDDQTVGYEDVFIPSLNRTMSLECITITMKPEYANFEELASSFPDAWKIDSGHPNSWSNRLIAHPDKVYTAGNCGLVSL